MLFTFISYPQTSLSNFDIAEANTTTITVQDMELFLKDKKEHYPFSDEFIERYQQTSGGYIDTAKKAGLEVNKEKHLPNQKWHYFDSWYYPSLEDETLLTSDSAQSRVYTKLLCPELLLWIYEACGVSPIKVKLAKEAAEQGKIQGRAVASIAKSMRNVVSWDDIRVNIEAFLNN